MTTARDIMSKKLVCLETSVSATEIAKLMSKNNVSCIILTKDERPIGIVTERDLLTKVTAQDKKSSDLTAKEVMSSPITLVSSMTPVEEVAQKMVENKVRRVIVADDGQAVGIITVTDFVKHLNSIVSDSEDHKKGIYDNLFEEYEFWNY